MAKRKKKESASVLTVAAVRKAKGRKPPEILFNMFDLGREEDHKAAEARAQVEPQPEG